MSQREAIVPESQRGAYDNLHYSPAIRSGEVLYCAGQIGNGADGSISADPKAQFVQAFENLKAILDEAGASFDDIVELTTFHVGFNDHIRTFSSVKDDYIGEPYPAWTAIGVSELAFGALVEVKATVSLR